MFCIVYIRWGGDKSLRRLYDGGLAKSGQTRWTVNPFLRVHRFESYSPHRIIGIWPSGKASVFGTVYRWFESSYPSWWKSVSEYACRLFLYTIACFKIGGEWDDTIGKKYHCLYANAPGDSFSGRKVSRREFCYLVYSVLFWLSHLRRGEDAFEVNACRKPFLYALLLDTFCKQLYYIFCWKIIGIWPSGKASVFGTVYRWFESSYPS